MGMYFNQSENNKECKAKPNQGRDSPTITHLYTSIVFIGKVPVKEKIVEI